MSLGLSSSTYTAHTPTGSALTFTTLATSTVNGGQSKSTSLTAVSTAAPTDTVKLSLDSQIKLLKAQGQDAKQIAANVGTTEKVVQQELGDTETAAITSQLASLVAAK
jgi:hypothetical protein